MSKQWKASKESALAIMLILVVLALVLVFNLPQTYAPLPPAIVTPSEPPTHSPSPTIEQPSLKPSEGCNEDNVCIVMAKTRYKAGEEVTFTIQADKAVFVPRNAQFIFPNFPRPPLAIEHSCIGIVGHGIDQYCKNGEIVTVEVGVCSDAVDTKDIAKNVFEWDQTEWVGVTEICNGKTIKREIQQQVPPGEYRIQIDYAGGTTHLNFVVGDA